MRTSGGVTKGISEVRSNGIDDFVLGPRDLSLSI